MTNLELTKNYIENHPNCSYSDIMVFLGHQDNIHARQYVDYLVRTGIVKKVYGYREKVSLSIIKRNIKQKRK